MAVEGCYSRIEQIHELPNLIQVQLVLMNGSETGLREAL